MLATEPTRPCKRLDFRLLDTAGETVAVGAAPPDADGLRSLAARLGGYCEPVYAAIESMNGARFVHDQLELAGWRVEIADALNCADRPDAEGQKALFTDDTVFVVFAAEIQSGVKHVVGLPSSLEDARSMTPREALLHRISYHGGFGALHAYTRVHPRHRLSCKSGGFRTIGDASREFARSFLMYPFCVRELLTGLTTGRGRSPRPVRP